MSTSRSLMRLSMSSSRIVSSTSLLIPAPFILTVSKPTTRIFRRSFSNSGSDAQGQMGIHRTIRGWISVDGPASLPKSSGRFDRNVFVLLGACCGVPLGPHYGHHQRHCNSGRYFSESMKGNLPRRLHSSNEQNDRQRNAAEPIRASIHSQSGAK